LSRLLVGSALITARKVLIPAPLSNDGWSGATEALKSVPTHPRRHVEADDVELLVQPPQSPLHSSHRLAGLPSRTGDS
jgi:hypothetical protein